MNELSHDVRLSCSHDEAIARVTRALGDEGFGVLSRIDLHDKFRDKLGIDFRPYTILGACNPALANVALTAAPEIGLMLPCNVTVEAAEDGGTLIRIINARTMMEMADFGDDDQIAAVGQEADDRLQRVAEALAN
jgi:uncharacterized protein (DUF302 family)